MRLIDCGKWTHVVKLRTKESPPLKKNSFGYEIPSPAESEYFVRGYLEKAPTGCAIGHFYHGHVVWSTKNYPWAEWVFDSL